MSEPEFVAEAVHDRSLQNWFRVFFAEFRKLVQEIRVDYEFLHSSNSLDNDCLDRIWWNPTRIIGHSDHAEICGRTYAHVRESRLINVLQLASLWPTWSLQNKRDLSLFAFFLPYISGRESSGTNAHGDYSPLTPYGLPIYRQSSLSAEFQGDHPRGSELHNASRTLCLRAKLLKSKEAPDPFGTFGCQAREDHDAVSLVTETTLKESNVAREKSQPPGFAKIPNYFLCIVPLRSTNFIPDLPAMDTPTAKKADFTLRNVVVQKDQAAGFFWTSRTRPRRVNDTASDTADGVSNPGYSWATFCGVNPERIISSASFTRMRVPLKISRPPQIRVSIAK